jgi:nucleoside-diphosphate-sugar epimerase
MTTIAITGIGGFIGLRMARRAQERGWRVQGLDLSEAAAERAQALGAEVTVGGVNDVIAVQHALKGADIVFHTAAIVEEDGARELYERVNVEGTRTVITVARDNGIKHFVHLSSVMVYGFQYPENVTEKGPLDGAGNLYNETKLISERIAMSLHDPQGMQVTVIRPGDVYGADSVPWLLRPLDLMRRGLFILPDGGRGVINHVHVDNLLDGVFLAIDQKAGGDIYNLSDGIATSCKDYFQYIAEMAGKRSLPTLPAPLVFGLIAVSSLLWRLFGKKFPASAAATYFLMRRHRYSIEKAQTALGYEPRISLDQGMAEIRALRTQNSRG